MIYNILNTTDLEGKHKVKLLIAIIGKMNGSTALGITFLFQRIYAYIYMCVHMYICIYM